MRPPVAWGAAAAGLAFAALFFSAGSSQSRVFWIGAAAVIVAAAGWAWRPPRIGLPGLAFFCSFAALVVWQGLSIAWSIEPSRSWDYTNRGLVYFAFAAVGALVASVPLRWIAAVACGLLGALFLWALAAKVVPGLYPDYERLARLRYPVEYWNELALLAAAAVPLGLWAVGPRHDRRARLGGVLLLYCALVVAVLTYSRVGIVLAVVAGLVWLWLDRADRLAVLGPLAVAWIGGGGVAAIGLLLPGVSSDGQPHDVRVHDGLVFGAAFVVGALVVGFASRFVLSRAVDRRLARAAGVALVVLVLAALAAAVVRAGGPSAFVSARWHDFSNRASAQVSNKQDRLISVSSSNRWRWWQEAWKAFTDKPLQGSGAGTFELVDRLERNTSLATTEPHSVPLQFLSETGIVGLLLYAAVIASAVWGILRRERTRAWLALSLAAALCVLHSVVDIDWDFISVQGPLFLTVGALVSGAPPPAPRRWLLSAVAAVCALAALYSLASPWLAVNRVNAAYDAILVRNDARQALTDARSARAFNPLSVDAIFVQALVEPNAKALQLYRRARDLEPKNAETWYQLGSFELRSLRRPRDAYRDLNQAYTLDHFLFGPGTQPGRDLDRARCLVDPSTCPK